MDIISQLYGTAARTDQHAAGRRAHKSLTHGTHALTLVRNFACDQNVENTQTNKKNTHASGGAGVEKKIQPIRVEFILTLTAKARIRGHDATPRPDVNTRAPDAVAERAIGREQIFPPERKLCWPRVRVRACERECENAQTKHTRFYYV